MLDNSTRQEHSLQMTEAPPDRSRIFLLAFTLGLTTLAFIPGKRRTAATATHLHQYCRRVAAARSNIRKSNEKLGSASGAHRNFVDRRRSDRCGCAVSKARRQHAAPDHVYVHSRDLRTSVRKSLASGVGYFRNNRKKTSSARLQQNRRRYP